MERREADPKLTPAELDALRAIDLSRRDKSLETGKSQKEQTIADIESARVALNSIYQRVEKGDLTDYQLREIRTAIASIFEVMHDESLEL